MSVGLEAVPCGEVRVEQVGDGVVCVRVRYLPELELPAKEAVRVEVAELPGLRRFLAFHQANSDTWTWPAVGTSIDQIPVKTQVLLYETDDGDYECIVPLVDGGFKGELNVRTGRVGVDLHSFCSGLREVDAAVFVMGWGEDPYLLVRQCFEAGMEALGKPGAMRWEKGYPDVFEYIGWCTWDAFYEKVSEEGILTKLLEAKEAGFPLGFVLIDDGWSPVEGRALAGFGVDREKFPRGLGPLVRQAKEEFGVRYVGLWHSYIGYWDGVAEGSEAFNDQRENLMETARGWYIPRPEEPRAFRFWDRWHSEMRAAGVDFVKVDNQGCMYDHCAERIPVGDASRGMQYGLQRSVEKNFGGRMLNCMCMQNVNVWHWWVSNVSRCSRDFNPGMTERNKLMCLQNVYNGLWYGNLTWPDYDMFWTRHPQARYHAAMRAISGGPVYISDRVDSTDWDVLRPLILGDGKLLRCDGVAMPTRDCMFEDTADGPHAVKVFNMANGCGVLAVFHASNYEGEVEAEVSPSDVEGLSGERFAVREFTTGETRVMARDERWPVTLQPFDSRFFVIAPIVNGFAALGLAEKYVSPKTVLGCEVSGDGAVVTLAEGGRFVAYSERAVKGVLVDGEEVGFEEVEGWVKVEVEREGVQLYAT